MYRGDIETSAKAVLGHPQSITERLRQRRDELSRQLRLTEEALAALEGDQKIANALDAISKLGGFL